jgi:hypothetical protein
VVYASALRDIANQLRLNTVCTRLMGMNLPAVLTSLASDSLFRPTAHVSSSKRVVSKLIQGFGLKIENISDASL